MLLTEPHFDATSGEMYTRDACVWQQCDLKLFINRVIDLAALLRVIIHSHTIPTVLVLGHCQMPIQFLIC